ncbi:hypothetical protein LFYK43_03220 [Ligilactobacillus salitolerans]|uniref:Uncharacterized protein n=1 Tax=Ligilactobacillus salitolerans TaxID=1808352 RepID=A0A401IQS2_9LACO|nr:hypothetical protein [Ligilactobacillus salitolerans]GBG93863.1 hypothetical protein LFYK43_03220 [Ligilactobacillus salitolerans]
MLAKNWEKFLLIACAAWQFIDGALTIFLGFFNPTKINELEEFSHAVPLNSFNGLIGGLFMLAGLVNLLIAMYFLKQKPLSKAITPILVLEAILAYLCMDIISVATLVPAIIIMSLKKRVKRSV